jgi:hypothetical protein
VSYCSRFTPSNPNVKPICDKLTHELCELPASGEGYSGLHPAWCFLIACACTEEPDEYAKMYTILQYIGNVNKSVRVPFEIQVPSLLIA